MITDRLRRVLNASDLREGPDGAIEARVDDVDRRYRDAIKSGATPLQPARTENDRRWAEVQDASENGRLVRLWAPA